MSGCTNYWICQVLYEEIYLLDELTPSIKTKNDLLLTVFYWTQFIFNSCNKIRFVGNGKVILQS